jgi:predicted nucleic-acid-binding protein
MLGVDTNLLVRLLVKDDARQAETAGNILSDLSQKFVIQPIVLCELVWVLNVAYGYKKEDIVNVISHLIRVENFVILDKETVQSAIELYSSTNMDFADAYIGYANKNAGCLSSITFDKKAAQSNLYNLV